MGSDEGPGGTAPSPDPFFDASRDAPPAFGKRFEYLGKLGAGGMGQVYKVRDRELDEIVALKLLSEDDAGGPQAFERMRREVKLARRISSPRVCRIHDIVELADGSRGVSMALIHGKTMGRIIRHGAGRDWKRTARWCADVAEGLAAAHALGIVHRDLKPDNVMIGEDDRAIVLDFGIAYYRGKEGDEKLTAAGIILGTVMYMAPEQLTNAPLDARCDLYALGLVIAEALTGEVPFAGRNYEQTLKRRVISAQPYKLSKHLPDAPDRLERLLEVLLESDRDKRPSSAIMIRDELLSIAAEEPDPSIIFPLPSDTAPDPGSGTRPVAAASTALFSGPNARPIIGVFAALIGALIGAALLLAGGPETPKTAALASPAPELAPVSAAPSATPTASPTPSTASPRPRPTALPPPEDF